MLNQKEILSTIAMIDQQHLDIRTITMGISLLSCCDPDAKRACDKIYEKITRYAEKLVKTGEDIQREFGIPIVNKRISVTPIALVAGASEAEDYVPFALALDRAAKTCGVNFIGGFSALVQKGMTDADRKLIASIPEALSTTDLVCSSVNVGSTKAGIDMDAVALMGRTIKELAERTADRGGFGCAKLVVFCNAVEDNPFMAGAFHGVGEPERVINVGVSGPGVVCTALKAVKGQPFDVVAETVKKTAFRVTRMGQLVAQEASRRLDTPFGIVDLSLAPTPAIGDSVARILEEMGLEVCGTHGTTAALALLTAVNFGQRSESERVLKITIPESLDYDGLFDDLFDQYTRSHTLERVKTANMGTLYELEYRAPRQVFSADRIMEQVWGWDNEAEINVVWVNISNLRKKLKALGSHTALRANRGLGYLLEAEP
mgnify:CR=1 FL=1